MTSYLVLALVTLAASQALRSILRRHKSGKSACGGDCAHCRDCH